MRHNDHKIIISISISVKCYQRFAGTMRTNKHND